ncbi:MAG: DUF1080 domain-containing protein [Saprospiraceae bacterium]|jgi:hypothetical protein|nr:DUF1080 domain-containing protein [Saprospiraceae bacterium]
MKKTLLFVGLTGLAVASIDAQTKDPKDTEVWTPEPRVVTPGVNHAPPSDAIVLFDGKNLNEWTTDNGEAPKWALADEAMTVVKGAGDISTKRTFGDCQLHVEFRTPAEVKGEGQGRGNSGIFLQSRYEIQVLDNYQNRTYSNGQSGSVYKQTIPLVNACRPPGEWQTYDIFYTAPRFNADGIRTAPARVTVVHNGVLIQNGVEIQGTTEYIGMPKNLPHGKGPIRLQDHGDAVSYRNIWVREL